MSQFKYENYDDQFQDNPSSSYQRPPSNQQKQPQTFKVLVKQKTAQNDENNDRRTTNKSIHSVAGTKNKLVDQHVKLKSQLQELGEKMDEIIEKQRQRKKRKNNNNIEDDERIVSIKNELREQELKMQKNKTEIARLRKNMDNKYDMNKIVDKENQLKHLKKQLDSLQSEKESLSKILKTQGRAIKGAQDIQSINKKNRMEDELRQVTQRTKKQIEIINEKQKNNRKLHEQYIIKQAKLKQYQAKLKQKKPISSDIHQSDIDRLEMELKQLEQEKIGMEKQGNERIRNLQREKKDLAHQLKRRKLILEEKEKQLRLNQMKHREIVRLINTSHSSSHPNNSIAQSRVSKQTHHRTVQKGGRQAPKIQAEYGDDFEAVPEDTQANKIQKKSAVEKHDYGFSANLQKDDDIIAQI